MQQFSQNTGWTLAEDLGHWKGLQRSLHNWVGCKKEGRRRGGGSRMGPAPRARGTEAEKRFPNSGKPPLWRGNWLGQKGSIWSFWKRVKRPICGIWDRVRNIQMVCTMALRAPDWDVCSQVCKGAGSWSVGIREQAWSKNCCWLWGDGLRGWEGGNPQQGMSVEEDQTAMEAGRYCWVTGKGRNDYCKLSLPTCWRQLPSNKKSPLRAGPHALAARQLKKKAWPGLALTCFMPGTREGPHLGDTFCACGHRLPCAFGASGAPMIQAPYHHCSLSSLRQTQEL